MRAAAGAQWPARGWLTTMHPSADVSSTYLQANYANLAVRDHGVRSAAMPPPSHLRGVTATQRLVRALEFADAEVENSHSKRVVKFIR